MNLRTLTLVVVLGCGGGDEPQKPPAPTDNPRPTSQANAHADPAGYKDLPAAGMVCRGTRAFVWTEDGEVAPLRSVRPMAGRDGEVYETYESVHSLRPGGKPVKLPDAGKSPRVVITSGTSMLVQASEQRIDIYRDGAWKQHARTVAAPDRQAVEHGGAWWFTEGPAIIRAAGDTVETAATLEGPVHALLVGGDELWAVSTSRDRTQIEFSRRTERGDFVLAVTFPIVVTGPAQVAQGADRAAVLLPTSADGGALFLLDPTRRPKRVGDGVQGLGAFDAAKRLWSRSDRALVVREENGDITSYPFDLPMFDRSPGTLCVPFGGGFAKLPPAARR